MHGKNSHSLVIADADAIISFVNTEDANHRKVKQIMQKLAHSEVNLLFPATAICEAVTVLRSTLNKPDEAGTIVKKFQSGDFPVQNVDLHVLTVAAMLFNPQGSKRNTLFDAVIAALAKQLHADAIFSFDSWYTKLGLRLASDLLEENKQAA